MCLCDSGQRSDACFAHRRMLLQCSGDAFEFTVQTTEISPDLILFYKCSLYALKSKVISSLTPENLEFTSESESSDSH